MVPHLRIFRNGPLIERAMSNLDAAEADLLNLAPTDYIYGQMPCLLRHVRCHLPPTDPARQEFERIAQRLGFKDPDHPLVQNPKGPNLAEKVGIVEDERGKIVTTVRAASSAALREHIRLRSFRNVVVVTSLAMALLAIGVAITGLESDLDFPVLRSSGGWQNDSRVPNRRSGPFVPVGEPAQTGIRTRDPDVVVAETAKPLDLMVVELVGLTAAAIATAAAIRPARAHPNGTACPLLSPPSSSQLARLPPSSGCCSCVANSSPASPH